LNSGSTWGRGGVKSGVGPGAIMMDKSVAELNIEHYRKLLASEDMDETKREVVETLLAAEQEKLAQIKAQRAAAKSSKLG
jgi:hypothetical protein